MNLADDDDPVRAVLAIAARVERDLSREVRRVVDIAIEADIRMAEADRVAESLVGYRTFDADLFCKTVWRELSAHSKMRGASATGSVRVFKRVCEAFGIDCTDWILPKLTRAAMEDEFDRRAAEAAPRDIHQARRRNWESKGDDPPLAGDGSSVSARDAFEVQHGQSS